MAKPKYEESAATKDLKERTDPDYQGQIKVQPTDPDDTTSDGYIAVDEVYRNHANPTDGPIKADGKGPQAKAFDEYYDDDTDFDAGATPEGESEAVDEREEEEESETSSTPSAPSNPPATTAPSGS